MCAEKDSTGQKELYEKKAYESAKSPLGQLPMFLFMMYMMGSSLSIFTIMFTVSFAMAPFKAVFNVNLFFSNFEEKGISLILPKLIYIVCNLLTIGVAAYRFGNMGILPVLPADWAGLMSPKLPLESNMVVVFN